MRQDFIFDESHTDELMITIPEETVYRLIKYLDREFRGRRNPKIFPDQPAGLAITMQWCGQFINSSQGVGKTTISSFSETLPKS